MVLGTYLNDGLLALLGSHSDDVLGAVHQDGISLHRLAVGGVSFGGIDDHTVLKWHTLVRARKLWR